MTPKEIPVSAQNVSSDSLSKIVTQLHINILSGMYDRLSDHDKDVLIDCFSFV